MSKGTELAAMALTAAYSHFHSHPIWTDPAFTAKLRQITQQLSYSAQSYIQKILSQAEIPKYQSKEQYCYSMELAEGSTVQVFLRPNSPETGRILHSFELFHIIDRQGSPIYLPREADFLALS